jgi:hypothetical protein
MSLPLVVVVPEAATEIETELVEALPELSVARAVTVWVPWVRPLADAVHVLVPEAADQVPPSICTSTRATPALSAAVPPTETVLWTVAPAAGVLILTVGAVVSAVHLREHVADVLPPLRAWPPGLA